MQPPHSSKRSRSFQRYASGIPAIGWALLSQSIWLPLLAIDAHDRWQSRVRELTPEVASPEPPAQANLANPAVAGRSRLEAGPLLASSQRDRDPLLDLGVARSLEVSSGAPQPSRTASKPSPLLPSRSTGSHQPSLDSARHTATHAPKQRVATFSASGSLPFALSAPRSPLSVPSLRQPPGSSMLALATRSSSNSVEDPLAALPSAWREPMRRALQQLPAATKGSASLQAARVIYVPSERISAPATVPLAIQPDGSLDIFSRPADPLVIEELRNWSNRQPQAAKGKIAPVVIHLSPIPKATTAMVSPPSSAASQLRIATPEPRLGIPSAAPRPRHLPPAATSRATFLTPPPPLPPLPTEQVAKPKIPSVDSGAAPTKLTLDPGSQAASNTAKPAQPRTIPAAAASVPEPSTVVAPEPAAVVSAAPDSAAALNSAASAPSAPASSAPTP